MDGEVTDTMTDNQQQQAGMSGDWERIEAAARAWAGVPRCQAVLYVRKTGNAKKCGRPIQYAAGSVYAGWEHETPYGDHIAVADPRWTVDHTNKRIVWAEQGREGARP